MKPASQMPDNATAAIVRLINSFPCLRAKVRTASPGFFAAGFDPEKFWELLKPGRGSELEYQCALFVAERWDLGWVRRRYGRCQFDLAVFLRLADTAHRRALADWIAEPPWITR